MDAALATMIAIAILSDVEDTTYYRWLGTVMVLLTLGTLLVPALRAALHPSETQAVE
jgi:hypothetical protein